MELYSADQSESAHVFDQLWEFLPQCLQLQQQEGARELYPAGNIVLASGGSWQTSTGFTEGLVGPGITQFFNTSMKTSM
jgi:hypothetical protein